MKKLKSLIEQYKAKIIPASADCICELENALPFRLSSEYKQFLSEFGVVSYGDCEVFGLGVPRDYYLNVGSCYSDLSRDRAFPPGCVPLLDEGDGRYYLYENVNQKVLLWATPNGGVVRVLDEGLEDFLVKRVFAQQ